MITIGNKETEIINAFVAVLDENAERIAKRNHKKVEPTEEALNFAKLNRVQQYLYAMHATRLRAVSKYLATERRVQELSDKRKKLSLQKEMNFSFIYEDDVNKEWGKVYYEQFKPARDEFYRTVVNAFKRETTFDSILTFAVQLKHKANNGALLLTKAEMDEWLESNNAEGGILPNSMFTDLGELD